MKQAFDIGETFNLILWFLPLPFLGLALSDRGKRWWPGWLILVNLALLTSLEIASQIGPSSGGFAWIAFRESLWNFLGGCGLLVLLSEGSTRSGWEARGRKPMVRRFCALAIVPATALSALLMDRTGHFALVPVALALFCFEFLAFLTAPAAWVRGMRILAAVLLVSSLYTKTGWLPFSVVATLLTATLALSHIRSDNRQHLQNAREAMQPRALQELLAGTTGPRLARSEESLPLDRLDALLGFAMQSTGASGGAIFLYLELSNDAIGTTSRKLVCALGKGTLRESGQSTEAVLAVQIMLSRFPANLNVQEITASGLVESYSLGILHTPFVAAAPIRSQNRPLGLVLLAPKNAQHHFGASDLHVLEFLAKQAVFSLHFEAVYHRLQEDSRLSREFEIAAKIQKSLLPRSMPSVPGIQLAARVLPAREVGGDYYDLLPLPDNRLIAVIGDVSGKGLPAGMIMLIVRTTLHLLVDADPQGSPSHLVRALEEKLVPQLDPFTFMTFLALRWSARDRILSWSGAGHEHILWRSTLDNRIHRIRTGGLALGLQGERFLPREERRLLLSAGDTVLLYTDGVTDCRAPSGEAWGLDRLEEALEKHQSLAPEEMVEQILSDLDAFRGQCPPTDDRTLVVLKAS